VWLPLVDNCADYTGKGHNGTPTSLVRAPGRFGGGMGFVRISDTSGSYIRFTDDAVFSPGSGDISLLCWAKLNSWASSEEHAVFANYDGSANGLWFLRFGPTTQTITGYMRDNSGNNAASVTGPTVALGRWYFYAMTWSASEKMVRLYIDGNLYGSNANSAIGLPITLNDATNPPTIGERQYSGYLHGMLNGGVSEFAILGRLVLPQEISEYYNWATGRTKRFFVVFIPQVYNETLSENLSSLTSFKDFQTYVESFSEVNSISHSETDIKLYIENLIETLQSSGLITDIKSYIDVLTEVNRSSFVWSDVQHYVDYLLDIVNHLGSVLDKQHYKDVLLEVLNSLSLVVDKYGWKEVLHEVLLHSGNVVDVPMLYLLENLIAQHKLVDIQNYRNEIFSEILVNKSSAEFRVSTWILPLLLLAAVTAPMKVQGVGKEWKKITGSARVIDIFEGSKGKVLP